MVFRFHDEFAEKSKSLFSIIGSANNLTAKQSETSTIFCRSNPSNVQKFQLRMDFILIPAALEIPAMCGMKREIPTSFFNAISRKKQAISPIKPSQILLFAADIIFDEENAIAAPKEPELISHKHPFQDARAEESTLAAYGLFSHSCEKI